MSIKPCVKVFVSLPEKKLVIMSDRLYGQCSLSYDLAEVVKGNDLMASTRYRLNNVKLPLKKRETLSPMPLRICKLTQKTWAKMLQLSIAFLVIIAYKYCQLRYEKRT